MTNQTLRYRLPSHVSLPLGARGLKATANSFAHSLAHQVRLLSPQLEAFQMLSLLMWDEMIDRPFNGLFQFYYTAFKASILIHDVHALNET